MGPRDKVVGAESEIREGVPHYETLNPGFWNPRGLRAERCPVPFPRYLSHVEGDRESRCR